MVLNVIFFFLDILHGPTGEPDDGRNGLVRFVLDSLGVDLDGLKKAFEQFSMIVKTTVVVLLVDALFLILAWVVWRVVRGARSVAVLLSLVLVIYSLG